MGATIVAIFSDFFMAIDNNGRRDGPLARDQSSCLPPFPLQLMSPQPRGTLPARSQRDYCYDQFRRSGIEGNGTWYTW